MNCHDCGQEIEEMIVSQEIDGYKEGQIVGVCHYCKRIFRSCEVWSRVVGYLRPIQDWNRGKQQEFKDRVTYKV